MEGNKTIGKLLTDTMSLHELHPDVVEKALDLPKGILIQMMNDEYYTNTVPVVLFKNLIISLHIPVTEAYLALLPTFRVVLSKETPESIKKKPQGYMLWENEDSVKMYASRFKTLSSLNK